MEYKLLVAGDEKLLEGMGAGDGVFDRKVQPELARLFLSDPRHHIAVAIEGRTIVGMASAVNYIHPDKPDELWINEVAVAESYRRRGIGRALLDLLFHRGRELGCREAWVLTDASNGPANRLYAALGGVTRRQVMYAFSLGEEGEGGGSVKDVVIDDSRYFWQGESVRLRPLRLEDAERHFIDSLDSPSRQLLQLGIELPTSVELLKSSLEKYVGCQDADGLILFIIENREGENVGGISFHSRDQKNGTFSFGIVVNRGHRGKGYAEEAARILLRYGFWERRYQKCNSACISTNEASIRLHEKLGFVEEGRRRRQVFFDGVHHDEVLFGLTREEFDAQERPAAVRHLGRHQPGGGERAGRADVR